MASLLARIQRANRSPLHTLAPAAARAAYHLAAEVLDLPRVPLPRVEDLRLPAADGTPLRARLYAGGFDPRPTLLYLHGGGFMIGGLDTHDSLCRQLALRSGWAVVSLDYRLAPEHRFPTAFDDAWSALQTLAAEPQRHGGVPGMLAIAGDSAGGT
ncbi:MAG: alpha/beta hydrolase fold domain-containing protein, partial [Rubrivivax sp.]